MCYIISSINLGGTFALYSLLRQHIHFKNKSMVPMTKLETDVDLLYHSNSNRRKSKTHKFLEGSKTAQSVLTIIVLIGTCMVMGDGALTPAISGLNQIIIKNFTSLVFCIHSTHSCCCCCSVVCCSRNSIKVIQDNTR